MATRPLSYPIPENGQTIIHVPKSCPLCHHLHEVWVYAPDYAAWRRRGVLVQDAFPYHPREVREILQTGIDDECFQQLFAYLQDEDEA
jgi:hypothetical protein